MLRITAALTAKGYDVAAVGVHKFPRHGLLHDLLHLEDQSKWCETKFITLSYIKQQQVNKTITEI